MRHITLSLYNLLPRVLLKHGVYNKLYYYENFVSGIILSISFWMMWRERYVIVFVGSTGFVWILHRSLHPQLNGNEFVGVDFIWVNVLGI